MSDDRKFYKVECFVGSLLRNTYHFFCGEESLEKDINTLIKEYDSVKVTDEDKKEFKYSQKPITI